MHMPGKSYLLDRYVRARFTSHSWNVAELLKVQVALMQISVQYELIGKAVSRSTQNLDQLVKVQ